jgi:hypothetical protein
MKLATALAAAVALGLAAPAQAAIHAFHCAFEHTIAFDGLSDTRPHNVLFLIDTAARATCIVDDLPAGNAGGAVDVARLYDSLARPGAHAAPYCVPGRRFGSFPNRAVIAAIGADRVEVGYRFLADGSGVGFDVALPSLAMRIVDPAGRPSDQSGTGRCRTRPLPGFRF